jgi:hypothetical protein
MATPVNPFFFETPSRASSFTDRSAERKRLRQLFREAGRRLLIYGRRRMGKTSLIQNSAPRNARLIYVDVSVAASMSDLARQVLSRAPKPKQALLARALQIAQKHFRQVTLEAGGISFAGEFNNNEEGIPLEQALATLNDMAADRDEVWTLCLDEFQEIQKLGGEKVDWRLRSAIQEHRNLNYIFTGSDHRIVSWMTRPKSPFFKQLDQMELGPIKPGLLANWIEERAVQAGGLDRFPYGRQIVATAGPCTGDVVRLAKTVFFLASQKHRAGVVEAAMDLISLKELGGACGRVWRELPVTQRLMLRAIAEGHPPTATKTLRRIGVKAASTAHTAIKALLERQILWQPTSGSHDFENPFFKRWVLKHAEAA